MIDTFKNILSQLTKPQTEGDAFTIFDPAEHFSQYAESTDPSRHELFQSLNAAFLMAIAGSGRAKEFLTRQAESSEWATVARFYLNGIELIRQEIEAVGREADSDFASRLKTLSEWLSTPENRGRQDETVERVWSVFFPEAAGVRAKRDDRTAALRAKRAVTITELNPSPLTAPAQQVLFTSNALLTIPSTSTSIDQLPLSDDLKEKLAQTAEEPQLYWFDHPIQIGVEPDKNEILYGLRGLSKAVEFERARGNVPNDVKPTVVLSASVTHAGLREIAGRYIAEEIARVGGIENLAIYLFAEADTRRLIDQVLAPAAEHYLGRDDAKERLDVFGVDGEYGRHYTFLKAIAPLWNLLIQPSVKATFKIDLDQVFPQAELVAEAGASALEHLTTPLWGAKGVDADGRMVELGMIAGALVNQSDIENSLFTPDVAFPTGELALAPDEYVFFSPLPQALSTEAEMMTRYTTPPLDARQRCIQRIHVTGGTNGVLVDSLRRHRPFTPSFIGRAEDQAYIFSAFPRAGAAQSAVEGRLAYVHKDGLIMRHDKKAFAQEAIKAAKIGKLLGDYVRILHFSTYARVVSDNDVASLKADIDPFTGGFVSQIPITVVYLRFALKAATFFAKGQAGQGVEFMSGGAERLTAALDFIRGENPPLQRQYEKERQGWDLYYDILLAIEEGLARHDAFALSLREKARAIVGRCDVSGPKQV